MKEPVDVKDKLQELYNDYVYGIGTASYKEIVKAKIHALNWVLDQAEDINTY